jgi:hypothetical protein
MLSKLISKIDPQKITDGENIATNCKALLSGVLKIMDSITSSLPNCPPYVSLLFSFSFFPRALRLLCYEMKKTVAQKFPEFAAKSVAGFIFLRFFNPVIVAPDKMISNGKVKSSDAINLTNVFSTTRK